MAAEEEREEKRDGERGKKQEAMDRLELAQSGTELYHNRGASEQEALRYASEGEN